MDSLNIVIIIVFAVTGIMMESLNLNFLAPLLLTALVLFADYFTPGIFTTWQIVLLWIGYSVSLSVRKDYLKKEMAQKESDSSAGVEDLFPKED